MSLLALCPWLLVDFWLGSSFPPALGHIPQLRTRVVLLAVHPGSGRVGSVLVDSVGPDRVDDELPVAVFHPERRAGEWVSGWVGRMVRSIAATDSGHLPVFLRCRSAATRMALAARSV